MAHHTDPSMVDFLESWNWWCGWNSRPVMLSWLWHLGIYISAHPPVCFQRRGATALPAKMAVVAVESSVKGFDSSRIGCIIPWLNFHCILPPSIFNMADIDGPFTDRPEATMFDLRFINGGIHCIVAAVVGRLLDHVG